MKSVCPLHEHREYPLCAQLGGKRLQGGAVTGEHGGTRRVDRGDLDAGAGSQSGLRVFRVKTDRQHRATTVRFAHDLAAMEDYGQRLLQRERTGGVRSRHLAHAVANHGRGSHPPGAPALGERGLQREYHGLGDLRALELRGLRFAAELLLDTPVRQPGEYRVASANGRGEHGIGIEQIGRHAGPLGALPGVDEDHWRGPARVGNADVYTIAHIACGEPVQAGRQLVHTVGNDGEPPVMVVTAASGRMQKIRYRRVAGSQRLPIRTGQCLQRLTRPRGDRQHQWAIDGFGRRRIVLVSAQHHVHIGTAETERTDTGTAVTAVARPDRRLQGDVQGTACPVHGRGETRDV